MVKGYLAPDVVLSILVENSKDSTSCSQMLNKEGITMVLSDFTLFEALHSIDFSKDEISINNLILLLNKCEWMNSHLHPHSISKQRKALLRGIAGLG